MNYNMKLEKFKSQLRETITTDFPGGTIEKEIAKGVDRHKLNYREYIFLNPLSNFAEWKSKLENSVNIDTVNPGELLSIGLFLLALDDFKPDE